jgi:outer membrane biosynthesis protein TonB
MTSTLRHDRDRLRRTSGATGRLVAVALVAATCPLFATACVTASDVSGHFRQPRLIRKEAARFPEKAEQFGILHGIAYVQVVIDTHGRTSKPKVLEAKPEGVGFDDAAADAVLTYQYEPASQNGEPVAVYLIIPVEFVREASGP